MNKKYYPYLIFIIFLIVISYLNLFQKKEHSVHLDPKILVTKNPREMSETISREENIFEFFRGADAQIIFFGRVIDENGNGVVGAKIYYQVRKVGTYLGSGKLKNTNETKQVISTMDGRFEIKNTKGLTLSVGPLEKEGYRNGSKSPRDFGFKGTPELHHADSQKPTEFVIINSIIPKTKEVCDKRMAFAWNKGEVRIILGNKLGDLVLIPTRLKSTSELRDFEWNIKVSMDRAEIVPLGEYYAPIAPDAGYQRIMEYGTNAGDDKLPGGASKSYAFKTNNGLYGLLRLSVYPEREDLGVNGSLDIRLNESGSRNLD
jgi:hypothetical protein